MRSRLLAAAAALAVTGATLLVACRSDESVTPLPPDAPPPVRATTALDRERREAMTAQFAVALADAGFRLKVRRALAASPIREHKLQFQRWISADPTNVRALNRASARPEEAMQGEVSAAPALEFYFPVPGDLERWAGGEELLVATTGSDTEAPVAFDVRGGRQLLSATAPPSQPVLALVPQETDFDAPAPVATRVAEDEGGAVVESPEPAGLYLLQARYLKDFEGWLKGAPEFDIHVFGSATAKDSLEQISCSGRTSPGLYNYRQTTLDWTGRSLLYTTAQLNAYQARFPGEGLRIVVAEDDDLACVARFDQNSIGNTIATLERLYPQLTGGSLSSGSFLQRFAAFRARLNFLKSVANFFTTSDDVVGNAVDATVTGESLPIGNWVVKGENAATNGFLNLQLRN